MTAWIDAALRRHPAQPVIPLAYLERPDWTLPGEWWAPIPGFEGRYHVSSLGRIRSFAPRVKGHPPREEPILLRPRRGSNGYAMVCLARGVEVYVHRAVLMAFLGPPRPGETGSHLDGDPRNNRLGNLRWEPHRVNLGRRAQHGTLPVGERSGAAKLTADQVRAIRARHAAGGVSVAALAREHGVGWTCIDKVLRRETWAHV